jgi:predicted nucleotidyltransferase
MSDFERSLTVLLDGGVEIVVIGGAAMYVHGSDHLTRDLDVCYNRARGNVQRLVTALVPHHPRLRGAPSDLPFRLDVPTVLRGLNFTLTTDLGAVDLLGEVAGLGTYSEVLKASHQLEILGRQCHVLSLDGLIKSKRAAGRPRDLAALPELEALQEMESHLKREGRRSVSDDPSPSQEARLKGSREG